jgi:hypothetical protein
MGKKYKQWQDKEVALVKKLYLEKKSLQEIYAQFPHFDYRRVYNKITALFPDDFQKFTMRAERNHEQLEPINYGTIRISVIEIAKNKLGDRVTEIGGSYYLDGKRCLVQDLVRASKRITVSIQTCALENR